MSLGTPAPMLERPEHAAASRPAPRPPTQDTGRGEFVRLGATGEPLPGSPSPRRLASDPDGAEAA